MANKKKGYIPLYRSLQDHWIWDNDKPFDVRSAWIDLLLSANHEEKKIQVGMDVITIKPGQMWTSYKKLADKWHWTYPRVLRYIKMLKNEKMICADGTPNGTLVTIVNWASFQISRSTDVTPNVTPNITSSVTSDVTSDVTQTINIKNVNNVKSERKEPAPPRSGGVWQ